LSFLHFSYISSCWTASPKLVQEYCTEEVTDMFCVHFTVLG
jgi:hypothetical protein